MKKILVTGNSGTVGTELCDQLIAAGYQLDGIDRNFMQKNNVDEFFWFDLLNYPAVIPYMKQYDLIIHLAANARVHNLVLRPQMALENMITTHNVFEFARINGIPRVLFASSREVYGDTKSSPVTEENSSQRNSLSAYTSSKILGESYCYSYDNCYGIDSKIMRLSNVYGKYDTSDRFIPKAIKKLLKDEPFEVYGKDKVLDFTHVEDCARGIIQIIQNWSIAPKEINIASGEASRLVGVIEYLKKQLKSKSEITVTDSLTGEVNQYVADISVIEKLQWKPEINIFQGIEKSIEYYKQIYK